MNTDTLYTLPANVEAERAVLGLTFLKNEWAYVFGAELSASDFSLDSHRRIFAAQQRLAEAGKPIDYVSVEDELRARSELEAVGGSPYVMDLTNGLFVRGQDPKYYSDKLRDKAALRNLIHAANTAIASAHDVGAVPGECFGELMDRLSEMCARTERNKVKTSQESMAELVELLDRLADHKGEITGLTTGIQDLDEITNGIGEGELWVVGARPGQGKTSLARQIARANVRRGIPVQFYSAEMPARMLRLADLAAESGIPFAKIRSGFFSKDEYNRMTLACGEMTKWLLYISEAGDMDIREMVAHAMMMVRQCKVRLIIVDHLQIVLDREHKERLQQVSNISNKLRVLAKTTNVPVVLLSQLSRPKDGDMRPRIWQLKESGDVEANAHTVIMPYLPQDTNGEMTHEDELLVTKQRYGETGAVPVFFRQAALDFARRETRL